MKEPLIHEELSYQILGCAFEVYKELGPFYRESIYQRAMEIALGQKGLSFQREVQVPVTFRSVQVGRARLDLIVDERVVVELKAVETIHPKFSSQVIHYLSASGLELGFVVNFGALMGLEYKRLVLSAPFRELSA